MSLIDLFRKRKPQEDPRSSKTSTTWVKCASCAALMYYKEISKQNNVCPKCSHHMRLSATSRIELLADDGVFEEFDTSLEPVDPLKFVDKKSYKKRVEEAKLKTKRKSAVIAVECKINARSVQLIVFDFGFMGGSLGSVEGEKIVRACNRAIEKNHGVIIVSASGGARMQESTFSLMQMAKTSASLKRLDNAGLPFISILTDPTFGGVSASFAFLGDILMAEPGALIGFAGARVIKQTIGKDLPDGFQKSEFLLEHGSIDMITPRNDMKKTLGDLLKMFAKETA